MSDIKGYLRLNFVNELPKNDDEKFRSINVGSVYLDAKINSIIEESIQDIEHSAKTKNKVFTCGLSNGEILEI